MAAKKTAPDGSASQLIDARIKALGDWRAQTLAQVRALIHAACPDIVETVKWRKPSNPLGVPVWEHAGIVCTGETYKDKVKLTFAKGAALNDPPGCSIPASTAICVAPSISTRATRSMIRRSLRWCAQPQR